MGLLLTNLSWGASFIKFQMSWPHGENRLNRHYSNIKTDLTRFEVAIHKNDATFSIYLTPKPSFANRISISTLQGNIQFSGDVVREGNGYAKVATIPLDHQRDLSGQGRYVFNVHISGEPTNAASSSALSIQLSPCSTVDILASLYDDTRQHDVFFVFNTTDSCEEGVEDGNDDKPVGWNEITCQKIGAHKLVLRQWPYFRRMFESAFVEGGPGKQNILIKDVNPATFRVLIRFMYASKIPQGEVPTQVCVDDQGHADQTSLEEVFLAAHRYELQELCESVQEAIRNKIDSCDVIPFLFRVGYLFDEIRAPLVKLAASSCSAVVTDQAFVEKHLDHPEFGRLLHEIHQEVCRTRRE